ncbi:DUF6647 family protein [Bradyrhizobium cosmicum]|uniref:DUF6647 family protein n=1 Tax=Bradyrhizobium cosmicum TaxID=1404864 RepID=UPI0028EB3E3E|nr:DUF6647 family protein [Bradyrhizobium cosmicum]
MFNRFLLLAVIASLTLAFSSKAYCRDGGLEPSAVTGSRSVLLRADATRTADDLLDEIVTWLSSNFDLPAIKERPAIEFASRMKLATMRAGDGALSEGLTKHDDLNQPGQRQVVALYNDKSKTILLPDDWTGTSPADQSILVHEMVHHLQNLGKLRFDCPRAREKSAYLAQDEWLGRFGMSLEKEFDVDMFTVLISSACMF